MSAFEKPAVQRALELAGAGECPSWPHIAHELAKEGYRARVIAALGKDRAFKKKLEDAIVAAEKRLEETKATSAKSATRMSPALPATFFARKL